MRNFWQIFAILALSCFCYIFSSVGPVKDNENELVEAQESVVSKHVRNHSAVLGSLREQVQRIEQEKGALASSFKALQTKSLDQAKLIKSQQEQLQSVQVKINATNAKNQNQMELIKSQQEQIQNMLAEINAMKHKQSQKEENESKVGKSMTESKLQKLAKDGNLHYILGVSTGHTGSVTTQQVLVKEGCPFKQKGIIELREPHEKNVTSYKPYKPINESDPCAYTRDVLIPYLDKKRGNATWIDAGHFHNRGPILECIAELLGPKVAFLRIRRNRHAIAASFSKIFKTSCFPLSAGKALRHPEVSYCPLEATTPIYLPVRNDTWSKLNRFQRFLWQADELEMRFHNLQNRYPESHYLEVTWSRGEELTEGLKDVRTKLGCQNEFEKAPETNRHIRHDAKNCSDFVLQDLEYRTLVKYNDEQKQVLFQEHPQQVHVDECQETKEQIQNIVASEGEEGIQHWAYN